jgi:deazaflavin-dependent oxidoreductase (nitroreductase family)
MKALLRSGLAPRNTYLLSVPGRCTGKLYSTPVTLVENQNGRWLVAPYGEVAWVRNARAAGRVTLSRGGNTEQVKIIPAGPEESAPILKEYVEKVSIVRPYFNVTVDSPALEFAAEAPRHPVFRLESA